MTTLEMRSTELKSRNLLLWIAWFGTLFASLLPVMLGGLLGAAGQATWLKLGVVAALAVLAVFYPPARLLRGYFFLLLGIVAADHFLRPWIAGLALWQSWFPQGGSWFRENLGVQILRLLPSLVAWLLLVMMGFRRRGYFMAVGDMDAPVEPVRWLSIKPGDRWKKTGLTWLVSFIIVTILVMSPFLMPNLALLPGLAALLPAVVFFAVLNAFNENFTYRAALLPVLLPVFGKSQALLLTAVLFGLGHLTFAPMGMTSFIWTGFYGWVLARSMIETRGFAWAWLIQFPMDVLAIGAVTLAQFAQ